MSSKDEKAKDSTEKVINSLISNILTAADDFLILGMFDLKAFSDEDQGKLLRAAIHIVVNGPVGIGQTTTWPFEKRDKDGKKPVWKIRDIYKEPYSNEQWKGFVRVVADIVLKEPGAQSLRENGRCWSKHGKVWPDCSKEWVPKDKTPKKKN